MTQPSMKKNEPNPIRARQEKEPSLKGTFASVMLLGAFLIVTWLGAFVLYLVRN